MSEKMNTNASHEFAILWFVIIGVVMIGSLVWTFSRSRSVLEQWAQANGYEILHSEFRNLFRGPFFWTSSKGQTVYYVRIRDREGRERPGWVRCGGFWAGLFSDKAEVRWDDESQ
jgi:hypothetical protein